MHDQSFLKRIHNPNSEVKSMDEHIAHFKQRLLERFNIELTTEEYYKLVNTIATARHIYQLTASNGVHSMQIKGVEVWVIYGKALDRIPARLKTALIPYKGLVVPNRLAHKYDNVTFTKRVGDLIQHIFEISKTIDLNDTKTFFLGHPELPTPIKSMALSYKRHNDAWDIRFISGVIRYLDIIEGVPFDSNNIQQSAVE